ncbi:MAG: phage holin family protein [Nitrospira sp.]|nr:phage holin family protein [Nitrospira sp.]
MHPTQHEHEDTRPSDTPGPPGVISLLHGIVEDVKRLGGQQVRLAIHELQLEGARAVSIVATAVITGILSGLCLLFLLLTAAAALHDIAGLAMWMSCGVIALILIVAVGGFLMYLKRQAHRFRLVPIRTFHTMKEDAQWIKAWIASPRT